MMPATAPSCKVLCRSLAREPTAPLTAGPRVTKRYGRMDIRSRDMRHGQGAAFMAHGYCGRPRLFLPALRRLRPGTGAVLPARDELSLESPGHRDRCTHLCRL